MLSANIDFFLHKYYNVNIRSGGSMVVKIKDSVIDKTKNIKKKSKNMKNSAVSFFKEKGKMKKIKNALKECKNKIIKNKLLDIVLLACPFIVMDIATRLFGTSITFYPVYSITPRLFSLAYIILFIGISINIKKKYSKLVYTGFFIIFFVLFLVQNVYYSIMNNFFGFSIMALAGEGSAYFLDALKKSNVLVYIIAVIIFIIYLLAIKRFPEATYNKKKLIKVSVIFIVIHLFAKICLGSAAFELTWDAWKNPKNVYDNFNDSNKCIALAGLYEYTVRDFYINYIKPTPKKSDTESNFLAEVFSTNNDNYHKNSYTGKFKGKNVIFLQLEGIDNWLLNKEIMPNTYKLLENSIEFTDHYAFNNGGGSTFNSEFMVNVGYATPYTFPMNAYTLNKNDFPYSMANLMKQKDYDVEAFHMNTREYYSRGINYYNWGYDNYLGLLDLGTYTDKSYELDRELILNKTFYNELFKKSGKTISYIITYSNHMPFTTEHSMCRELLNIDYADKIKDMKYDEITKFYDSLEMTEEDCIRRQAKETDYMVGLLMQGLKDNGLYNNTVIFAYADHYLYTVSDNEILRKNGKDVDTNLINKTPFFIWSAGMKHEVVTKTNSQLDILPTFLNLMGVTYNDKWYGGYDILDKNYRSMVIFPDLSWYDGKYYVVDGEVANDVNIVESLLEEKNSYSEYLIKKNDLVLKYNYFKEIMN